MSEKAVIRCSEFNKEQGNYRMQSVLHLKWLLETCDVVFLIDVYKEREHMF